MNDKKYSLIVEACAIWADIVTGEIPLDEVTDEQWELAIWAQGVRYVVKL